MALEILFALTVVEIMIEDYIILPAVGVAATVAGMYVDVKTAQFIKDHYHADNGDPIRYVPARNPGRFSPEAEQKFGHKNRPGDMDGRHKLDTWEDMESYFHSDWKRDEPAMQEVLSEVNAAMWFHDTGMNEADLERLRGMKIRPHPDDSRVDRAIFEKDGLAVEGSFLGGDQPHIDGIRTGNFSAVYPGIGVPLEGTWIVVNRTEASDDTTARFEKLRSSMTSAQGNGEASRKVLFEDLMQAAVQTQAEEQEQ